MKRNEIFNILFIITGILAPYSIYGQSDRLAFISPQIIENPNSNPAYSAVSRKFTGIPSLAISLKGQLWAVWYAGKTPGEDHNNYVVVSRSIDNDHTWKEELVIDPDGDGPVRAFDPEIWIDTSGKLWVFWAQATSREKGTWALIENGTSAGLWSMQIDDPDIEDIKYSAPKRLTDGVMMCKPVVLSTGEWMLPVSLWKLTTNTARAVVSTDQGKTWKVHGGASVPIDVRNYDEHMIIERIDGSLWMLVRTKYGIGESISNNRGQTWSELIPSKIKHPAARFFIQRLNSGNLLLVKHGPVDMLIGRSHLMAFISQDDGQSWSKGLLLDERAGVSYPDGQQSTDGTIFIIYDFDRRGSQNIILTSFSEDDIMINSDNTIVEVYQRRKVVSKGGQNK